MQVLFTVQLTLPYAEELAEKDSTTAEQNLHGLHLLLAEDNPLNQELCLELLKSRGISSDCAVNGKEALELFTNSAPGTYALISSVKASAESEMIGIVCACVCVLLRIACVV